MLIMNENPLEVTVKSVIMSRQTAVKIYEAKSFWCYVYHFIIIYIDQPLWLPEYGLKNNGNGTNLQIQIVVM